jgi:hypothetical protein
MINRLIVSFLILFYFARIADVVHASPSVSGSLFASGKWLKIETPSVGVHKIYYSWLKNIGFLHPERVRIFGSRNEVTAFWNQNSSGNRPVQVPFLTHKERNGDTSVLFYVQGPVSWGFDAESGQYVPSRNQAARGKSYYYLTEDAGTELVMPITVSPTGNPDIVVSGFDDFVLWEEENVNLLESGSRWFTTLLPGNGVLSKNFKITGRLENELVKLNLYAAGRSEMTSGLEVSVNGNILGNIAFSQVSAASGSDYARLDSLKSSGIISGADLTLSMKRTGLTTSQCWFDYAILQFRCNLHYNGLPLVFRDAKNQGGGKILEFRVNGSGSGLTILDITDPLAPSQIAYQQVNGQLFFKSTNEKPKNYLLFDPSSEYPSPAILEEVKNADLVNLGAPEYVILTPAFLLGQANRLASFHRQVDGQTVEVVTAESVFNEYSGGYPDIYALRYFIRSLYEKKSGPDGPMLKYLLLFGKGTFDPVHPSGESNPNWIPAFQSENSLNNINSYVTDDFFGQFESSEKYSMAAPVIGIGRIPAVSEEEALTAVDKIIHYHEARTLGEWRNNLTFIGDDEDNNIHTNDSEKLTDYINEKNPEYHTGKIYLDAYPQELSPEERYPAATEAILRSVRSGSLIVNYIGHASEDGLAHEKVLAAADIEAMTNRDRLPLFVTATCEFSRWDMVKKRSAGEKLLFNPAGGAIALLSATRLVYAASNFEINKSFFKYAFQKDASGVPYRLGDLIRLTKSENSGSINTLKFCLLGDPALRLDYPEYGCKDLEINNQPAGQNLDSASPLSQVTIKGEIQDRTAKKLEMFNGSLSVTVYDQPSGKRTLGNGGFAAFTYRVQDNILFKGTVPVKNGSYVYSFVVPKDVSFNSGAGLIRYYFFDGNKDGNGAFDGIRFNGTDVPSFLDFNGPGIQLFLENKKFRDGDAVSQKPLLLAVLNDASGINTSGTGIGHDITLELDGDIVSALAVSDYYQADPGSWTSGTLSYLLSSLAEGEHILKLKAWDNANNSSTATIRFLVKNDLKISGVLNFPNPFSDKTNFIINQNRFNEFFQVNLDVSDLSGRIISSSTRSLGSGGYEIFGPTWDPGQLNPVPAAGIYIYRITLTGEDGRRASKSGRLVWRK